jgi:hypothetical protein
MRIVDEAIQDGVGVSGVANDLMPGRQGELGGDDRRPTAVSLLENFEQIVTGAGVDRFEAEVVENEQIGATDGFDEARMPAVASGERQVLEELWPAVIEDGAIVATGFLADGAGQPALADAGRTGVILPGVRRLKSGSRIGFTRARVISLRWSASGGMQAPITSLSGSPITPWRCCRRG